jgi:phage/plasmid-associated DNA primase
VLGMLYYKGNTCCITQRVKGELNVSMANCHKKNFILFNEPSEHEKIITAQMKDLTDGKEINARTLYSTRTKTKIQAVNFMMANNLPLLDSTDGGVLRRIIVIKFNTLFKDLDKFKSEGRVKGLNDDGKYYYLANTYFKSAEFIERVKLPMMNLLIKQFRSFKKNNFDIGELPQAVKNEIDEYINKSSEFLSWFKQDFKKTNNKNDILKLREVYKETYTESYLYDNLNKKDKRQQTSKWFIEKIKNDVYLQKDYRKEITIEGKHYRNVLIGYKKVEIEDDDLSDLEFE